MSKFLVKLIDLVNNGKWIEWRKVVENADKETLLYLRDEAQYKWKYFTRDDWMDGEFKAQLFDQIKERLSEIEADEWFSEVFKELINP